MANPEALVGSWMGSVTECGEVVLASVAYL